MNHISLIINQFSLITKSVKILKKSIKEKQQCDDKQSIVFNVLEKLH